MKRSISEVNKRRIDIIDYLKADPKITNTQLSKLLNASSLTIRRDLQFLEEQGVIRRHYGGSTLTKILDENEQPLIELQDSVVTNRMKIAKFAASQINEGDIIFINSSATALEILNYIGQKNVVVVTNNGNILQKNIPYNIEVMLTGGQLNHRKQSMVGDFATYVLQHISASKCFLGVSGIDYNTGISTAIMQETNINKQMIMQTSGEVFVVADSSKVLKPNNFSSGSIDQVSCLITDTDLKDEHKRGFELANVRVVQV